MSNVSKPRVIEIFCIVMQSNYSIEEENPQNLAQLKNIYHSFIRLVSEKFAHKVEGYPPKTGLKIIFSLIQNVKYNKKFLFNIFYKSHR